MSSPPLRPLSIGETLDVAFGIYRQHLATLISLVVLLTGVPLVLFASGAAVFLPRFLNNFGALILGFLVFLVLYLVLSQLAMGASVLVIAEGYLGRTLRAGEAVKRTVPMLGLLVGSAMLVGLVSGLGFFLIIVPGVILFCGLIVTTQVVMIESPSSATGAMARAWALTRGYRGRIFLFLLVVAVISVVLVMGADVVLALVMGESLTPAPGAVPSMPALLVRQGIQMVVNMIVAPLPYCILTVAYYDLRVRKEAFDLDLLASALSP